MKKFFTLFTALVVSSALFAQGTLNTLFSEDWQTGYKHGTRDLSFQGWENINVKGTQGATYYSTGDGKFVRFQGSEDQENWVISPSIDLRLSSNAILSFENACRYGNSTNAVMTLLVSTDYTGNEDPASATWEEITCEWDDVSDEDWGYPDTYVKSGDLNLDKYCGNKIYFAFRRHTVGNDGDFSVSSRSWQVDNISLQANNETPSSLISIWSEDFTNPNNKFKEADGQNFSKDVDAFHSATGMTLYNVTGTSAWYFWDLTNADDGGVKVAGSRMENEAWMISPALDCSKSKMALFSFISCYRYGTNKANMIGLYYSTDYAGTGDPTAATWNEVACTFGPLTSAQEDQSTWGETQVLIDGLLGHSKAYIAFKAWTIDAGATPPFNNSSRNYFVDNISLKVDIANSIWESEEMATISLYPNPAVDNVNINLTDKVGSFTLEIIDLTGRVIKRQEVTGGQLQAIPVAEMPSGVYIVKISNGSESYLARFVRK